MTDILKQVRTKQAKRKADKARREMFSTIGRGLGIGFLSISALASVVILAVIVGHYYAHFSPLAGM